MHSMHNTSEHTTLVVLDKIRQQLVDSDPDRSV